MRQPNPNKVGGRSTKNIPRLGLGKTQILYLEHDLMSDDPTSSDATAPSSGPDTPPTPPANPPTGPTDRSERNRVIGLAVLTLLMFGFYFVDVY